MRLIIGDDHNDVTVTVQKHHIRGKDAFARASEAQNTGTDLIRIGSCNRFPKVVRAPGLGLRITKPHAFERLAFPGRRQIQQIPQ